VRIFGTCICVLALVLFFIGNSYAQGKSDPKQLSVKGEIPEKQKGDHELKLKKETPATKRLQATEEEKAEKEKEALSAAGREYILLKKRTLELEYNFIYEYYSVDQIRQLEEEANLEIEHQCDHTLRNIIVVQYGVLDNLTLNASIPFIYRYDKVGTKDKKSETDIGDVTAGLSWQPFRSGKGNTAMILYTTAIFPSGRSPYEIDPNTEISTGNGFYSFVGGLSLTKSIDPVVVFGNLNYVYKHDIGNLHQNRTTDILLRVKPGDSIGLSIGMAYAMSYIVSLNLKFQYSYEFGTTYYFMDRGRFETANKSSASFIVGSGWRISPKTSLFVSVGIGLTNEDPDFSLSFRLPFTFPL